MSNQIEANKIATIASNKFANITSFYFLGIGGIGMSALARYFFSKGYTVGGYDRTPSPLTKELEKEGIICVYEDTVESIPQPFLEVTHTAVVRTPAVPLTSLQYQFFLNNGYQINKRAEVLGLITRQMRSLCVAGTHGKTTTSTMLAHLLYQSDIACNAFLGGVSSNYGTNLLLQDDSNYVVIEADEYDRSFLQLTPYMTVVTSVDPDHLDIYGTAENYRKGFEDYCSLITKGGVLLLKHGIQLNLQLQDGVRVYRYGLITDTIKKEELDFYADNVQVKNKSIFFDFHTPTDVITEVKLGVPVWINIENAVAAMAIAWLVGVENSELRLGISSFKGTHRRFNIHVNNDDLAYIDDYAHHPTELRESILSVKRLYPDRHIVGIFQPHLYTRTRDFAQGFAEALSLLDEVILLPIYPARELPIEGVNSEMLLSMITTPKKQIVSKEHLLDLLHDRHNEVIMTLGAGDIDRLVEPIKKTLTL